MSKSPNNTANRPIAIYKTLLASCAEQISRFRQFLRNEQQIMLVPHSGKKLHTFRISNRSIIIFLTIITFLILFSILSLNDHETKSTTIASLSTRTTHSKQHIQVFSRYSTTILHAFGPLFQESAHLSRNIGGIDITRTPIALISFSNTNYNSTVRAEMQRYDSVGNNLLATVKQISNAYLYLQTYRSNVRSTPSIWPIGGEGFITSPFGRRRSPFTGLWQHHTGVDIAYWPGTPILATADGVVEGASYMGGYGLCVVIRHLYGFRTRYGHMSAIRVSIEQAVTQGQVIGAMGSTGLSTGYHLHYEVILGNRLLNPAPYLINRTQL